MTIYDKLILYAQLRQARAAVRDTSEFNHVYAIRSELTQLLTGKMACIAEEIKTDYDQL